VNTVDDSVVELAARAVDALGVELLESRWTGSGSSRCLRLVVDAPGGVNADTCAAASRQFDLAWEAANGRPRDFSIEVNSPGPDRPLATERDFNRVKGRWVEVEYKQGEETISMTAEVAECGPDALTLSGFEEPVLVPLAGIQRARIVFAIGKPTPKRTVRRSRRP